MKCKRRGGRRWDKIDPMEEEEEGEEEGEVVAEEANRRELIGDLVAAVDVSK